MSAPVDVAAADVGLAASDGLTSAEAARRLAQYGPNAIAREHATPTWVLLARQFNSPVIWLLVS